MAKLDLRTLEGLFILGFGVGHLSVPFQTPPAYQAASPILFWGLQLADFVIPGCITLALISAIFFFLKDRYSMAVLIFMYLAGAACHALFFLGLLPPLIIVPQVSHLAYGAIVDTFTAIVIYDYRRRYYKNPVYDISRFKEIKNKPLPLLVNDI